MDNPGNSEAKSPNFWQGCIYSTKNQYEFFWAGAVIHDNFSDHTALGLRKVVAYHGWNR